VFDVVGRAAHQLLLDKDVKAEQRPRWWCATRGSRGGIRLVLASNQLDYKI